MLLLCENKLIQNTANYNACNSNLVYAKVMACSFSENING